MAPSHSTRTLAAFGAFLLAACVDGAPAGPNTDPAPLHLLPSLALVGPDGLPPASVGQADALAQAFDRVDRFRMVVRSSLDGQVVVDTVIVVTPGQESYDLAANVTPRTPDERFLVELTAMEGTEVLFSAPPVAVQATREGETAGGPAPAPVNITLTYSGPGAEAASVTVSPMVLALAPESQGALQASVLDADGNALSGVPLGWTSDAEDVVTVDADGGLRAHVEGGATVTATTPTGLQAEALVYVVGGELAYVMGDAVLVRTAAGGSPDERATVPGVGHPAWSPDGGALYFDAGGQVFQAGSAEPLLSGAWPAVSMDGGYLAVERDASVVFANADGSLERVGPSGRSPVWAGELALLVGGGSIERVNVADMARATVVGGTAALPAVGSDGRLAWVDDGSLRVEDVGAALADDVVGRPTWSQNGLWLVYPGASGVMVVPADGSGPPAPLNGLGDAVDPAFRPSSPLAAPSAPVLTGLSPDPPIPGQPVAVLGRGFDLVVPANNRLSWPTPEGSELLDLLEVSGDRVRVVTPNRVAAGQIRLENRGGTALLDYVPTLGALQVSAVTPWGAGVAGVEVVLRNSDGDEVARGETDEGGSLLLAGLTPGSFGVTISPPNTFRFEGDRVRSVTIGTETVSLELVMRPVVRTVETDPQEPSLGVNERLQVVVTAFDASGTEIPSFGTVRWNRAGPHLGVGGSGLHGTLVGAAPSDPGGAEYTVSFDGQVFLLQATVTSTISGTVTRTGEEGSEAAPGWGLSLEQDGVVVARTEADGNGRYAFAGLLAGSYTVRPDVPDEGAISPQAVDVTLGVGNPEGQADFAISNAVYAQDFRVLIFSGGHTNNNEGILREFEARFPDITFETAFGAAPDQAYLATFSMVFLYENGIFSNSRPVGDALAQYLENGGNIVMGTFYWQDRSDSGWGDRGSTEGWGALEEWDPFVACRTGPPCPSNGGSEYNYSELDPTSIVPHPLTDGVTSLWVNSYHGGVTAKDGTAVLASWDDGVPLIGFRIGAGGQRIVGVSVFPGYMDFGGFGGDFYQVWENTIRWAGAGSTPSAGSVIARPVFDLSPQRLRAPAAVAGRGDGGTGTRGGR